jgi:hypothetical protein
LKGNVVVALEPPHIVNPLTKSWHYFVRNVHFRNAFSKYFKLAKITIVHVIRSVEDERMFSTFNFMKSNIQNTLQEHLLVAEKMYS